MMSEREVQHLKKRLLRLQLTLRYGSTQEMHFTAILALSSSSVQADLHVDFHNKNESLY